MGKFDGMDPKLVRDLLAEVKHAVTQMRSVEGRVGQVMSGAGLATQTTHRPVQVADAAEVMVRDVTARLGLLEKKADHPRVGDQSKDAAPTMGGDAKDDDQPKEDRGDERSKYENPRADDGTPSDDSKPDAKTGEDKPDVKTGDDKPDAKTDDKPGEDKPDVKTGEDKPDVKTGDDKPDAKTDDKPDAKTDDKPDAKTGDDKPDAKTGEDKPDAKGCDDDKPDAKTGEDKPDAKTGEDTPDVENVTPDTDSGDEPKDDDIASRRDRGADSDSGIIDTPAKDHPNDSDPHKPQVLVVDGVKVLQVPIDPPTAEALRDLLDNLDKAQPADMPSPTDAAPSNGTDAASTNGMDVPSTNGTDVNAGANDGSDVVSVDAKSLSPDALSTVVDHARDIQPIDMPTVEVPPGEYGKGEWAAMHISPDGQAGTIDPGSVPSAHTPSTGDSATGTPSVQDISGSTADTAATADTPSTMTDTPSDTTDTGGCQATDTGTRSSGDAAVVKPTDPPGQQVPDNGTGRVAPTDPPIQQVPDNGTGHVTPTEPSGQRAADASTPTVGEPVVVGPTAPSVEQGGAATPPASDAATPPVADASTRPPHATTVYAAAGVDAAAWGGDGGDVVSVDAKSLDSDALRTLVQHHRDVQPLDMPSVEVPPGEYGEGQWALRDIQPDGPPGTVEPGTHERSV
ncbi:hypothetical protein [Nonomuraea sp. NEAU-A123]|uniref:hypothetical protein n=1 Tax=Nonomuraea sp. NEAU-A123 TaxID=2839649 RepID=UPI001BE47EF4|nr:hypothetical protein [Nonomuraea sp. NEAU-A123]MBT2232876.1 hypothetical protein [Nonomuraea sp. NEAU-A123]